MSILELDSLFDGYIEGGTHYGAQLAVYRGDRLVYAREGGVVRPRGEAVQADSPFMIYSVTKSLIAAAVHKLAGEGRLDVDAPLARYWPAFGRKGKDGITIAELLTHRAGFQHPARLIDLASWLHPAWMARRIASLPAVPGQRGRCVYHSFSAHAALGELIARLSGRSAAAYLRTAFFEPLGMKDSYPGLPWRRQASASGIYTADPAQAAAARVFSLPPLRAAFLPAASVNATARDLARFYAMLGSGGAFEGRRYIDAGALSRATQPAYDGPDGDSERRAVWSEGFSLGGYPTWADKEVYVFGRSSHLGVFGHAGQGGCALAWADPSVGLAMAFVNNRFLELEASQRRSMAISDAVRKAFA